MAARCIALVALLLACKADPLDLPDDTAAPAQHCWVDPGNGGEPIPAPGGESGCGPQIACVRGCEVCVLRGTAYGCVKLPQGCDTDRSCNCVASLCGAATCTDEGHDNTVICR
jgi:hypothetical protein